MCARVSPCSVITLLNGMFIAFHSVHSKSSPESSCPPSGQTICAAFDLRSAQEKLGKTIPLVGSEWKIVAVGWEMVAVGWDEAGWGSWTWVRMCSRVDN